MASANPYRNFNFNKRNDGTHIKDTELYKATIDEIKRSIIYRAEQLTRSIPYDELDLIKYANQTQDDYAEIVNLKLTNDEVPNYEKIEAEKPEMTNRYTYMMWKLCRMRKQYPGRDSSVYPGGYLNFVPPTKEESKTMAECHIQHLMAELHYRIQQLRSFGLNGVELKFLSQWDKDFANHLQKFDEYLSDIIPKLEEYAEIFIKARETHKADMINAPRKTNSRIIISREALSKNRRVLDFSVLSSDGDMDDIVSTPSAPIKAKKTFNRDLSGLNRDLSKEFAYDVSGKDAEEVVVKKIAPSIPSLAGERTYSTVLKSEKQAETAVVKDDE
jgi:hypothetical protein